MDIDARRSERSSSPTAPLVSAPERLPHGATRQGASRFIPWDRIDSLAMTICRPTADVRQPAFRHPSRLCVIDTASGYSQRRREMALRHSRSRARPRGIYIDDERYGRLLISWTSSRGLFSRGGSCPATVTSCRRPLAEHPTVRRLIAGRSSTTSTERTTETLDVPTQGLEYYVLFDLLTSIVPRDREARDTQRAGVTLRDGEKLHLERAGDLGNGNAGMLIFVDGRKRPEYVSWADVEQVDFDHPPSGDR